MNLHNLFENTHSQSEFQIGDPVIITGNVQFRGKTGDVQDIGRDGAFVVVNLYNYGPKSFHSTDVSLNDYADSDDEQEYQQGVAEASLEEVSQQTLQSYRKKASAQKRAADDVVSGDADDETWKKNVNLSAKRRKGIDSANKRLGVAEGSDSEELANEVYREFERIYPNLARRADERTVHAAIMDVLNYGGDNNPAALAQDVARTVRRDIEQGVAEGVEIVDQDSDLDQQVFTLNVDGKTVLFTYWDYENNFQNPDIKDIYQQAREQLGKKLSPEQIKAVARSVFKSFKSGVAEGSDNISSMIQQYEDMVELVYDLLPGRKKNIAIDKRDALEAQIEAMPGGVAALRKWAKSYNDAVDEGVAEGSEREMDLDWHYKNIMQTKGLSDKAKKQTTDIYNKLKKKKQQGVSETSDISGLIAAASMVQDYIVTAEVDGQTKRFRVRGMTGPTAARERFLKHASQARVIDVKPAAEKNVTEAEKNNEQPWVDPKLKRKMDYAFGHYAGYKDKPEAFFKWVMNSLEHSEENDQQHDRRFDRIEREIDQLSQRLKQVNEQHGAAVADRFSQRLAERFAADRPTADPARELFAESRSQKRAAIREIFANQG